MSCHLALIVRVLSGRIQGKLGKAYAGQDGILLPHGLALHHSRHINVNRKLLKPPISVPPLCVTPPVLCCLAKTCSHGDHFPGPQRRVQTGLDRSGTAQNRELKTGSGRNLVDQVNGMNADSWTPPRGDQLSPPPAARNGAAGKLPV